MLRWESAKWSRCRNTVHLFIKKPTASAVIAASLLMRLLFFHKYEHRWHQTKCYANISAASRVTKSKCWTSGRTRNHSCEWFECTDNSLSFIQRLHYYQFVIIGSIIHVHSHLAAVKIFPQLYCCCCTQQSFSSISQQCRQFPLEVRQAAALSHAYK